MTKSCTVLIIALAFGAIAADSAGAEELRSVPVNPGVAWPSDVPCPTPTRSVP